MNKLRSKHKEFADRYLEIDNGTQSIKDVYKEEEYDDDYAAVKACKLLKEDKVKAYLENNAGVAASNIVELANNAENETVRLNANKDILDRSGYKPTDKIDHSTLGEKINSTVDDDFLEKLVNKLKDEECGN